MDSMNDTVRTHDWAVNRESMKARKSKMCPGLWQRVSLSQRTVRGFQSTPRTWQEEKSNIDKNKAKSNNSLCSCLLMRWVFGKWIVSPVKSIYHDNENNNKLSSYNEPDIVLSASHNFLFNPGNSKRQLLLLPPFYDGGHWGLEKLSITCPRSHGWKVVEPRFQLKSTLVQSPWS